MTLKSFALNSLAIGLSALLCNVPNVVAQTSTPAPQSTQSQPAATVDQSAPDQNATGQNPAGTATQSQSQSARPDPSQAPLAPVPSARPADNTSVPPDAPSEVQRSQQTEQTQAVPETPAPQQRPANPLGTATAQQGATRGGVASKPAGEAIAPAKQHQVRSLLIKVGLVAAGAAAIGTVVGLTRGTSSVPPGSAAR
jgi:outer membrane biosynthesis protein TonB